MAPQSETTPTILFIEDTASVADSSAKILRKRGYRVVVALDAGRAVEIGERERDRIALIVADVGLELYEGREVVASLRDKGIDAPVLFVSGGDVGSEFRNDRFLPKPWTPDQLIEAVQSALQG